MAIVDAGHAWIASGYRAREYRPDLAVDDLLALRELFLKEVGRPRWSIVYGTSMGGQIAVASLELQPGVYQGGFAECGLVDGIGIADYLFAYTAAAELISVVKYLMGADERGNELPLRPRGMARRYPGRRERGHSMISSRGSSAA